MGEISDGNNYFTYSSFLSYNYIKNELNLGTIIGLILLSVFILSCRSIIRFMINLCSSKSIHYVPQQRAIEVVKYYNPFVFHLHHFKASCKGVKCTIKSETDCFVAPLWNVPIYDLFILLHQVNLSNINKSISDFAAQSKYGNSNDIFFLSRGEELTKEFELPPAVYFEETQTSYPRLHYPFVLIMFNEIKSNVTTPQMILLTNIIHIPDEVIKLPAQLYQQYAKSTNGYLGVIKKIYTESFDSSHIGNNEFELCVVCMSRKISVVVIPCGHTCLCQTCFECCKNCPICRGPTHYYFVSTTVSQS